MNTKNGNATIGEVCKLVNGRAFKPAEWSSTGLPIIRIQNLNDETRGFNYYDGPYDKKHEVNPGDLLFSWSGTPGTSFGAFFWNRPKAVLNQHIFNVHVDRSKVEKRYFRYAMNHRLVQIIGQAHGGVGLKHITKGKLEAVEIPLPPLSEQKRIADILDKADAIRRKRQEAIKKTEDVVRATFLRLFGDPVNNPKQWPLRKLGDIVARLTDGEHLNPTFVETGTPMVMAANVLHHGVSLDEVKYVTKEDGAKFRKKCGPVRDDLLIVSRGATIGRCSIVDSDIPFCLMGSVILVKPNVEIVDSTYMKWLFSHHGYYNKLFKTSGSSAQQAIYLTHLRHLDIPVPQLELQSEFKSQVQAIQSFRTKLDDSATETSNLFDSLVQRAFKGEL